MLLRACRTLSTKSIKINKNVRTTTSMSSSSIKKLSPPRTCVFLCDVQSCFEAPVIPKFQNVKRSAKIMIEACEKFNWNLFVSEQVPEKLGRTADDVLAVLNAVNAMKIVPSDDEENKTKEKQFPMEKKEFGMFNELMRDEDGIVRRSAFGSHSTLKQLLFSSRKGDAVVEELRVVLLGVEAHVCVYQTIKQIVEYNESVGKEAIKVHVLCDGVASQRDTDLDIAMKRFERMGCVLTTTEMFLFEEMKTSEHPLFRDVSKLVRKYK